MPGNSFFLFFNEAVPRPAIGTLPEPLRTYIAAGLALKKGLNFLHGFQ